MTRRDFTAGALVAMQARDDAHLTATSKPVAGKLRAGVAATNITPPLGSSLGGNFTDRRSTDNHDELWAKSLVLDNGGTRLAICLMDLCMLSGSVGRRARQLIEQDAGVPATNILLCCTHTHSAPPAYHIFQSPPNATYMEFLTRRIVDSVRIAAARLQPASLGFGFGREDRIVFNRRYHMKPGTVPKNPFGGIDQVVTNPGIRNPNVVRPAGPIDPTVGIMSVRTAAGKPLAVVGNYCLHYVGGEVPGHVSADYFAYWAAEMARRLGVSFGPGDPPFIAMLTNGAEGNVNNVDVLNGSPERQPPYVQMARVANILADVSAQTVEAARYSDEVVLGASEEWLDVAVRLPLPEDIDRAQKLLAGAPANAQFREAPLIYARETVILAESYPKRERVRIQALRIGDVGVSALPGEPFVELGLEIRRRSPLRRNLIAGLSNDSVGYIPTAEAHEQGGYETWRAKTSYLEKNAASMMTAAMLRRLDALAG